MKNMIGATLTGLMALALAGCDGSGEKTFTPSDRDDQDSKAEADGEPRGAAAAAALLDKTRNEADERKSSAEDDKAVRAFIDGLYGGYTSNNPVDVFGKPELVFDPALANKIDALRQRDEQTGDMSDVFGADPICGCQDWGNFSHTINSMTVDGNRATAKLTVRNFGEATPRTLTLARTAAGWRVYDLGDGFRASVLGS